MRSLLQEALRGLRAPAAAPCAAEPNRGLLPTRKANLLTLGLVREVVLGLLQAKQGKVFKKEWEGEVSSWWTF